MRIVLIKKSGKGYLLYGTILYGMVPCITQSSVYNIIDGWTDTWTESSEVFD